MKSKDESQELERKTFTLDFNEAFQRKGDDDNDEEDKGVVTAVFAKTGVVDRGGDFILPGAFGEQNVVVSAFNHASSGFMGGDLPVGKGRIFEKDDEAIAELQFFLNTDAGRQHFEVIKALGGLQEYSFGFLVLETGELTQDLMKIGVDRVIKSVQVFEVSPVLLGEGIDTRTLSVKKRKTEKSGEEFNAVEVNKEAVVEFERFNRNVTSYLK